MNRLPQTGVRLQMKWKSPCALPPKKVRSMNTMTTKNTGSFRRAFLGLLMGTLVWIPSLGAQTLFNADIGVGSRNANAGFAADRSSRPEPPKAAPATSRVLNGRPTHFSGNTEPCHPRSLMGAKFRRAVISPTSRYLPMK